MNKRLIESILKRKSIRSYNNTPIEQEKIDILNKEIERINHDEQLNIQLVVGDNSGFDSVRKTYGLISGVENYLALVGNVTDEHYKEKLGYFGQELLILCESLGLSTCWIGGSFDKKSLSYKVEENQELDCVIAVGYPRDGGLKEKFLKMTTGKKKEVDQLYKSDVTLPEWIEKGVELLAIAPSAMNRQPVIITYFNGEIGTELLKDDRLSLYDLGIAKFHFTIGAEKGRWQWGPEGRFICD